MAGTGTDQLAEFSGFADAVGLAFQVHDDILDVTGNSDVIGKQTLSDQQMNKPTYISVLGLEASQREAERLHNIALLHLERLPQDTSTPAWLAGYVVERDR